ncbi:natural cytotoxicity triggering receptor 1 isoform X4 [Nomascus leucogenys]|uniref:natural cytotoxicity triggering receptor 1 isoform X4 n=1 Tax=Nomascus leucogenys TaxID=61853 RepID=UPI00122D583E|nr:natural cytotoxicity triggering receptor 1 isoform X4 [Nomascus leucogenys]
MSSALPALLCVGLCLSQRISAQQQMYDTPTLSVHPGPEVISGEKVTFYCRLDTATSMFLLLKEERSTHVQRGYGKVQAEFPLGPVTTAHRGTYRCFGSYNKHAWSFPSEPVKLLVTGDIENTSLAPEDPTFPADPWDTYLVTTETGLQEDHALWDHTAQNLLRMGLAFLVLVALVWFLVEDWLGRKRTRERASRASTWEGRRRPNTKTLKNDHETQWPWVELKAGVEPGRRERCVGPMEEGVTAGNKGHWHAICQSFPDNAEGGRTTC